MKGRKSNIDDLTALSLRYSADDLSPEEVDHLQDALLEDPELRKSFMESQMMQQGLSSLFEGAGVSEEIVRDEPTQVASKRKIWVLAVPMAAAAVVLLGLTFFYQSSDDDVAGPVVSLEMGAQWKGRAVDEGDSLVAGRDYQLDGGSVRLQLTSGASVAIQGPARFQVPKDTSDTDFILLEGDVVVRNEGGTRVRVASQERLIVCENGAFGIESDTQGAAKLCVLNGEVKVEDFNKRPALLTAGFAAPVESLPSGITLMSSKDRMPMQQSLLVACSVRSLAGVELLYASDVEYQLMDTKADGLAYLLPENRVELSGVIPVSALSGGVLKNKNLKLQQQYQCVGPLQSYLLHMNPETREKAEGPKRYRGSITFDRPIEALIASKELLDETEWIFASHPDSYPPQRGRGLEQHHGWDRSADGQDSDVVSLSDDRKTLVFDVRVGSGIDQVRILTQADK